MNASHGVCSAKWREIAIIPSTCSAGIEPPQTAKALARKVPKKFATRITAQSRAVHHSMFGVRCTRSGRIAVRVFSVNSCSRPRITSTKPTE